MGTLITAYLLAWAAVTAYVAWLAIQNHRLAHRLDELQTSGSTGGRSIQGDKGVEEGSLRAIRSAGFVHKSEVKMPTTSDF
jgi:hypothetical protein